MPQLITHSGPFHADDLVAYSILHRLYPYELVRTREPKLLESHQPGDVMFDVGLAYDPTTCKYDHHQKGGAGQRENGVPYASAGLVWKHHGKDYLRLLQVPEDKVEHVHTQVDRKFIQSIDAEDCGVTQITYRLSQEQAGDKQPIGLVNLEFSKLLFSYNPVPLLDKESPELSTARFMEASSLVARQLELTVQRQLSMEMGQELLVKADHGEPILVLEDFVSWQSFANKRLHIQFVVFPSSGGWRCQTVSTQPGGFVSRKPLPECWAGLNEADLAKVTGVPDATFCHNQRFIAGAASKEGALALARLAAGPELSKGACPTEDLPEAGPALV